MTTGPFLMIAVRSSLPEFGGECQHP